MEGKEPEKTGKIDFTARERIDNKIMASLGKDASLRCPPLLQRSSQRQNYLRERGNFLSGCSPWPNETTLRVRV